MKLLIIGDALSQFTTNFSRELKAKYTEVEIDIVNFVNVNTGALKHRLNGVYSNIYNFRPLPAGLIGKIPKIRGIVAREEAQQCIKAINRKISSYNVILMHGFWNANKQILDNLYAEHVFKVGAFWGGDFYDRGINGTTHVVAELLERMDRVCISTKNMEKDILEVFDIPKSKIRNCLFGLKPLDNLFEKWHITQADAKKVMGFDEQDIILTCGYNACENMQHLEMLRSIASIRKYLPDRLKIILPLTYGDATQDYLNAIKRAAESINVPCTFLQQFLSDEEVMMLRKATDVFIQVQQTDAYSGSMQEHLFAQNIVITGAWLPYEQLKEKGIYFEEVGNMNQLSTKLMEVLQSIDKLKRKVQKFNTCDKFSGSRWQVCIDDWYNMLNEYKQ